MRDSNFWLAVGIFVFGQLVTSIGIIYNRGRKDAYNESNSIARFKINEGRIETLAEDTDKRLNKVEAELKQVIDALGENAVLLARVDERTHHIVKATERIESKMNGDHKFTQPR